MTTDVLALQQKMDELRTRYLKLQQSRSRHIDLQHENTLVLEDLKKLKPDVSLFYAAGPALIPESHEDAKQAVEEKIAFIQKRLESLESQTKEVEGEIKKVDAHIAQVNKR